MDSAIKQLTLGSVLIIAMITSAFERHLAAACLNDYILSRRQVPCKIVDYINGNEPRIVIEEASAQNESSRLIAKDRTKFVLDIAIRASREDQDSEITHLNKAACIVRRHLINFKEFHRVKFCGSVKYDKANLPALLTTFITNIIAGEHSFADPILVRCRTPCMYHC